MPFESQQNILREANSEYSQSVEEIIRESTYDPNYRRQFGSYQEFSDFLTFLENSTPNKENLIIEKFFNGSTLGLRITKVDQPATSEGLHIDRAFASKKDTVVPVANLLGTLQPSEQNILPEIEFSHIDSRKDTNEDTSPYIINLSGIWGTGPEVQAEIIAMALTMGEPGFLMDIFSLPGHGYTSDLVDGWGKPTDFDQTAKMIFEYIRMIRVKYPNRPIIIHAWSMGGATALKVVELAEKLKESSHDTTKYVDGIILLDTPVYPMNLAKAAARFATYPAQPITREPRPVLKSPLMGLEVFLKRILERNRPGGMPLQKVVIPSAQSMTSFDGTEAVAATKRMGVPVLLLTGENDYVIPHELTDKLANDLQNEQGTNIQHEKIKKAGHALVDEQPREVSKRYRRWMQKLGFIPTEPREAV